MLKLAVAGRRNVEQADRSRRPGRSLNDRNGATSASAVWSATGRRAPIPAVRGPIHSPALNGYAIGQTAYEYRATAVHD